MESADAHRVNEALVLRALVACDANSRQQIVRETGLSKATVSRLVRDLIEAELVVEGPRVSGPDGGRATQTLEFQGASELVCGVDMGGMNTRFIVVDQRARLVGAWSVPTPHLSTAADLADWMAAQLGAQCPDIARLGLSATVVGVPGVVHPATGDIQQAPNLRAIEGAGFAHRLGEVLPGQLSVHNDSNTALVGELCAGVARGSRDVVMVTIGIGVGAGVALEGRLVTGARGLVGEFGMLPVELDGTVVEDVISGGALASLQGGEGAFSWSAGPADDPDQTALRGRILGGLFTVCMAAAVAYEPEMIVFGGRVSASLGAGLERVQERLNGRLESAPQLTTSRLGDAAGALGAVAMGLQAAHRLLGADAGTSYGATGRALGALAVRVVDTLAAGVPSPVRTEVAEPPHRHRRAAPVRQLVPTRDGRGQ